MFAMPNWVVRAIVINWKSLLLASFVPLMLFLLLLYFDTLVEAQPEGLVGEAAKQQRKDVLGYAIYAVVLLLVAVHGFLWSSTRFFLGSKGRRQLWAERFSFPLGFRPVKSFFWTFVWLLFAMFAYIAVGMVVGTLGFNDPGLLLESVREQSFSGQEMSTTANDTGEAMSSSAVIGVSAHNFNAWVLVLAKVGAGGFGAWILLKALIAIPLRVIQGPVNLLHALRATPGFQGVRVVLWVVIGGCFVWLINQHLLASLSMGFKIAGQSGLFIVSLWLLAGLLSWHVQKSAD